MTSRHQWRPFAAAVVVTLVLVGAVAIFSVHRDGGHAASAANVQPTTTPPSPTEAPPSTSSAPTTPAPTTTTQPKPGLGLLTPPAPTPVALPGGNLAPVYSRIPTTNKVIFLGIDDGLVRDPAVTQLLADANVPFTMFLVKEPADDGTDYFRQLQQVGGTVEDHTITHPDLTKLGYAQVRNEVCGTLDDFQNLFGRRPTLFRPPYGSTNQNVQLAVASCGLKAVILWKGSTNDGRFDLQDGTQLTPGDIVLMHFRTDLLQNLERVFQVCREQGFAIARLEDYIPS